MISIKKYIEQAIAVSPPAESGAPLETLRGMKEAYLAVLTSVAEAAEHAVSASSSELLLAFARLRDDVRATDSAPQAIHAAQAARDLQAWSDATALHLKQKADEVRELLLELVQAGEEIFERDQRYASQFEAITQQLHNISQLDDLSQVRVAVMKSAAALKRSTAQMAADGAQSVRALRAQVGSYQSRLEEAEKAASLDSLTGLRNRPRLETLLERRLEQKTAFCVVLLDLNGFKQVNDTYGHAAGDELLKQFARELNSVSRSSDVIGRWGGDEFVMLVDAALEPAAQRTRRAHEWAAGEYTLPLPAGSAKVSLDFAYGIAEALPGDTMAELLRRADEAMYRDKKNARSQGKTARKQSH